MEGHLRAALYARVSSEEQVEGYSIDAQKRAFQAFAEGKRWDVYREYVDEGKSARTDNISKRPAFKEMITDALAGKFDVVVVHKLDRFARNLRITLEYFDKLSKAGISFVSINENMDFSTPWGRLALTMLGGLAQFYSDNLSQETKKGWQERKEQGLYCGALPFGAIKGEDGIPVPDMQERDIIVDGQGSMLHNYEGLKMAFELADQGKSDKAVAIALNASGYRTTGTHGSRPFSKDTVRGMLKNRFYIGCIDKGNGQLIKAQHQPFISDELWSQAQESRERNRRAPTNRPSNATVSSLTGITHCWYCKGRIHVGTSKNGKRRMMCYSRSKGWSCPQKSTLLEVYEYQIEQYLETFYIPDDYQAKILEAHGKLRAAYTDAQKVKARINGRLDRLKKLFSWGDITEENYLSEKHRLLKELQALTLPDEPSRVLERLSEFLRNVTKAWKEANQEQRNSLARQLFEEIWVKDSQVIAVRPRPELEPFFRLSYEDWLKKFESASPKPIGVAILIPCYLPHILLSLNPLAATARLHRNDRWTCLRKGSSLAWLPRVPG